MIMTVAGPIPADELGATLIHEHLYCDISPFSGKADNILTDEETMIGELAYFRAAGGRTIVEVTPEGIGRNPVALRRISLAAGVRIVAGIAFYDEATVPDWAKIAGEAEIADYFVRQLEKGADGVRAGVIGELYSHNEPHPDPASYRLTEFELTVFRAAARAQRRTGAPILTHASLGRGGHAQLAALETAGADPARIAIGHCDAHWHEDPEQDLAYYLPILERGAFCAFDLIGWTELMPDALRAARLAALIRQGYASHLLLSSDTCRRSHLHAHGGRGYDNIWRTFLPLLRQHGVTDEEIQTMLVEAPRQLLTG